MTEEEAKTKWCPFARLGSSANPGFGGMNRDVIEENGDSIKHTRCIGSACMAWRVSGEATIPSDISTIARHMRTEGVGPLAAVGATSARVPVGYCGLAGAPQ